MPQKNKSKNAVSKKHKGFSLLNLLDDINRFGNNLNHRSFRNTIRDVEIQCLKECTSLLSTTSGSVLFTPSATTLEFLIGFYHDGHRTSTTVTSRSGIEIKDYTESQDEIVICDESVEQTEDTERNFDVVCNQTPDKEIIFDEEASEACKRKHTGRLKKIRDEIKPKALHKRLTVRRDCCRSQILVSKSESNEDVSRKSKGDTRRRKSKSKSESKKKNKLYLDTSETDSLCKELSSKLYRRNSFRLVKIRSSEFSNILDNRDSQNCTSFKTDEKTHQNKNIGAKKNNFDQIICKRFKDQATNFSGTKNKATYGNLAKEYFPNVASKEAASQYNETVCCQCHEMQKQCFTRPKLKSTSTQSPKFYTDVSCPVKSLPRIIPAQAVISYHCPSYHILSPAELPKRNYFASPRRYPRRRKTKRKRKRRYSSVGDPCGELGLNIKMVFQKLYRLALKRYENFGRMDTKRKKKIKNGYKYNKHQGKLRNFCQQFNNELTYPVPNQIKYHKPVLVSKENQSALTPQYQTQATSTDMIYDQQRTPIDNYTRNEFLQKPRRNYDLENPPAKINHPLYVQTVDSSQFQRECDTSCMKRSCCVYNVIHNGVALYRPTIPAFVKKRKIAKTASLPKICVGQGSYDRRMNNFQVYNTGPYGVNIFRKERADSIDKRDITRNILQEFTKLDESARISSGRRLTDMTVLTQHDKPFSKAIDTNLLLPYLKYLLLKENI